MPGPDERQRLLTAQELLPAVQSQPLSLSLTSVVEQIGTPPSASTMDLKPVKSTWT